MTEPSLPLTPQSIAERKGQLRERMAAQRQRLRALRRRHRRLHQGIGRALCHLAHLQAGEQGIPGLVDHLALGLHGRAQGIGEIDLEAAELAVAVDHLEGGIGGIGGDHQGFGGGLAGGGQGHQHHCGVEFHGQSLEVWCHS